MIRLKANFVTTDNLSDSGVIAADPEASFVLEGCPWQVLVYYVERNAIIRKKTENYKQNSVSKYVIWRLWRQLIMSICIIKPAKRPYQRSIFVNLQILL